jgi:type III secretion protein W
VTQESAEFKLDEQKLLLALIKTVAGGWISPSQFERIARDLNIPDGAPGIYFLTGIKHILRELPFKLFVDDDSRSAVLEALQVAIDNAIDREESASESGERALKT